VWSVNGILIRSCTRKAHSEQSDHQQQRQGWVRGREQPTLSPLDHADFLNGADQMAIAVRIVCAHADWTNMELAIAAIAATLRSTRRVRVDIDSLSRPGTKARLRRQTYLRDRAKSMRLGVMVPNHPQHAILDEMEWRRKHAKPSPAEARLPRRTGAAVAR